MAAHNADLSPTDIVRKVLANTLNEDVLRGLVAPDAEYISLTYSNPALTSILPWAGTSPTGGAAAIIKAFGGVERHWQNELFEIQTCFNVGEDVAVFGKFVYRSRTLGKASSSPFAMWCKVRNGMIVFLQFLEDSFGTTETFYTGGPRTYKTLGEDPEVEI